eukprot:CAMPEP_0171098150 /NCGR_PEP_ID=MMETSP0766_2-20121228/47960_1 /TAXON_ID=439317 /ORGANISM="Gambierdiscus australes, Strain CAWD 149" /LENGTH=57 /DNA_ID=CAMNT_0011557453 /DNA_START=89 /DNA_END=259 /DNA_ORIENTATION=-
MVGEVLPVSPHHGMHQISEQMGMLRVKVPAPALRAHYAGDIPSVGHTTVHLQQLWGS